MAKAVLIAGYPASGKSSLAEEYRSQGFEYLNRDQRGGKVSEMIVPMAKLLQSGKNVVVDNTFPDRAVRQPFVDAAYRAGAEIHCIFQDTSIEDAQVNACQRMIERHGAVLTPEQISTTKSPNIFPPAVLFKYRKELEKPTEAEGFHSIELRQFVRRQRDGYTHSALILDYDGTLRESTGEKKWPRHPKEVKALPKRKEKLAEVMASGLYDYILGASNQSGIAKGDDETAIKDCFHKTNDLVGQDIDFVYCPHKVPPITCYCRKPMPGMGVHFIEKYKLDPAKCLYVGDSTSDKTFAGRCGFKFMLAKTFFGK